MRQKVCAPFSVLKFKEVGKEARAKDFKGVCEMWLRELPQVF